MLQSLHAFGGVSACERGDVVVCGRAFYILVKDGHWAPIKSNTVLPYRGNILIEELSDLVCMGLPGGEWVIQCGKAAPLAATDCATHVGSASPLMMEQIKTALTRIKDALEWERKYSPDPKGYARETFTNAERVFTNSMRGSGARQKGAINTGA